MHALVVALNPSVDVEWRVGRVRWEEKNSIESERRWPGGKGVNVARWLRHLGSHPRLLLPLGGPTGHEMKTGLQAEGLECVVVPLREATRANVIITTAAQGQLRFNPPGPTLSRRDWADVRRVIARELVAARLLILSGSLPRGVPATAYRDLLEMATRAGVPALLDCDGPPLAAALEARPFLVKPNLHELAQLTGRKLSGLPSVRRAAAEVSQRTGGWVMASLGDRGALLWGTAEQCHAAAPQRRVRNTVGAGDAMLAAVACQILKKRPPADWLRHGIAAGTALTACEAGVLPSMAAIQRLSKSQRVSESVSQ